MKSFAQTRPPIRYRDYEDENIQGSFYEPELQMTSQDIYSFELKVNRILFVFCVSSKMVNISRYI